MSIEPSDEREENPMEEKPLISIVLATYNPNLGWLREQLRSLDAQTYPRLNLFLRDDCSDRVPFSEIRKCAEECVHAFPVTLCRNKENLGSTKTFELLTQQADGAFLAYCDQDDVWLPEKISRLVNAVTEFRAALVCSDMYVMDASGKTVADSITEVRRHHRFLSGEGLAPGLFDPQLGDWLHHAGICRLCKGLHSVLPVYGARPLPCFVLRSARPRHFAA